MNQCFFSKWIFSLLLSIVIVVGGCDSAPSAQSEQTKQVDRPNIILINADDLGIGMLGCYGQTIVTTPNIDQLAAEGMRFTNFYGGVFCAPSRWTLLTGLHDGRLGGWKHTRPGLPIQRDKGAISEAEYQRRLAVLKESANPIHPQEVFLAQVAQQAGYTTAQFGKLDRGFLTWAERVERFGWDFHEGYYDHQRAHGFYPPYLWRNGEQFELDGNTDPACGKMSEKGDEPVGSGGQTYSQEVFINDILSYLRKHKDQRFFLYHSTQLPHGPVAIPELHPDFADAPTMTLAEKKYASMVKMLDDHVGLIMAELKKLGIDQQTVVFFTSDNGHELYYGPKPSYQQQRLPNGEKANLTDKKWRASECGDIFDGTAGRAGLKRSVYQGGMQVPMIVRWPGRIQAGTETNLLAAHYDFMATMADIIGASVPAGKDSVSYLPTLLGQSQQHRHDYVVVNSRFNKMGRTTLITNEGWKLIEIDRDKDQFQLYNIHNDNEERNDLQTQHPDIVNTLKKILFSEIDSPRPDIP